jgi:sec-independent protein translocase protein TatA
VVIGSRGACRSAAAQWSVHVEDTGTSTSGPTVGGVGSPELLIVALVVLLLFGSTKLPSLARSLGEAQRELKKGQAEGAADKD